ncbi:S9 family peptidase [bacterium]|nr:S9 family peptidase [bacterium]
MNKNTKNCLLFCFLLASGLVNAAEEPIGLSSVDVSKIQAVQSAEISPDGKWIAVRVVVPRQPIVDEDGTAWTELHVIDVNTKKRKPFITGKVSIGAISWSSDSKTLYYTAKRFGDSKTAIYQIPVDGGESIKMIEHAESIKGFDVSNDGRLVSFLALEPLDENTKTKEEQGFSQEVYEEALRATRVWIAKTQPNLQEDEPARLLDLKGSASAISWNSAGDQLAVVAAPTPTVDDGYMKKQVHVVDVDSSTVVSTLATEGKLGDVMWSPSGNQIAVICGRDQHDPADGRLVVHDLGQEDKPVDLMPDYKAHVIKASWLSEEKLVWLAEEGLGTRIGSVTLNGDSETLLEPGTQVFSDLSIDDSAENLALVGNSPTHPNEVFLRGSKDGSVTRLTDHNPWLKDRQFGRQTAISWTARDGLSLQGVLVYPIGYQEGHSYPTIMYVHGGPEAHESNGWLTSYSRPGQVAAAKGFAVFYPNYRGSTGRGVEFSMLGQSDAAGREFDDLVDGVDHLVELGVTDKNAVGVTGGSYGGYASAWCSTYYSDRFAASVMFVGISDNLSKVGTTDIPEEMYLVHHRKRLWEDWDYFLERSPIRYVERNKTPTLILHGKEDPRVHPSQSLELHRHLKTLDQAPVRLILYPGEGHGNRRAASRFDYNLRMLRWMEHFLVRKENVAPDVEINYDEASNTPDEQ